MAPKRWQPPIDPLGIVVDRRGEEHQRAGGLVFELSALGFAGLVDVGIRRPEAGSDFIGATNVPVTFNPGQTLQFVTVKVIGDTIPEPKEKFTVHLHATNNAVLANNTKRFTILNDD